MQKHILYDPTVSWNKEDLIYAQRPRSLEGLRLGLMDNLKHNAGQLLQEIARVLIRSSGVESYKLYQKRSPSQPARYDLLDVLATECDGAICGVGD
jgi:hypothetical protein